MTETTRITVPSEAVGVTLFEDRAEVTRRARCAVPAGITWVALTGVTVALDDPSLVAGVKSDKARVIAARVVRRARQEPAAAEGEITACEADVDAARRRCAELARALSRAQGDEARWSALEDTWAAALQGVPRGGAEAAARWREAYEALDAAFVRALDAVAAGRTQLAHAELDRERAQLRVGIARLVHARYEATVEVQVEAGAAHDVQIDLTYRTPCALWRPEHLCQLVARGQGEHELVVRTSATVWQRTGEAWTGVVCRFSTARPAQSAAAPPVAEDVLVLRRKTEAEKRTVVVEARDQSVAVAGLDRGVRAVDEMPGVEDGGEPLWFEAAAPTTIPSDGAPFRVEIAEARMPCEVDRVAFPERGEAAHVRATATLAGRYPLLAGPVRVARGGELVGRGRTGFVGRGDVFELGFGVDDGLRVRRHVDERRETTPILGTQKLTRTVRLYVSNLGGAPKHLAVIERYPVSEVRDLEVAVTSSVGARLDPTDGFARWEVEIEPRGTRELTLTWKIEAPGRVLLPF